MLATPAPTPSSRPELERWHAYLRAHADPRTRVLHVAGTVLAASLLVAALLLQRWLLVLAAPFAAYGMAWLGHAVFEGNVAATFGRPLSSLRCDLRMVALLLAGRLEPELRRAGVSTPTRGSLPRARRPAP